MVRVAGCRWLHARALAARQHGQSAALAVAKLGCCASSGSAWRLRAARDTQGERPGHWAPSHCPLGARASRLQRRRFHRL